VLCLIVVLLPPGKNPFAVQLNNNNKFIKQVISLFIKKIQNDKIIVIIIKSSYDFLFSIAQLHLIMYKAWTSF
jgi:hypothetical protein